MKHHPANQATAPNAETIPAELHTIFNTPEAELALLKEYNLINVMLEASQAIILILDKEANILFFNAFLEQLSGFTLAEVKGKNWFTQFLPTSDHAEIRKIYQTVLDSQNLSSTINPIITRDNHEKIIEWHNKTLRDGDGSISGVFSYGHDITEKNLLS